MKVNKIAIILVHIATSVLLGCSSTAEKNLNVDHGGQAGVVDTTTTAYPKLNMNGVNNNTSSSAEHRDKVFNSQSQEANNNQVSANINNVSAKNTVYFLYDSSEVEPAFIPLIEKQSQDLLNNSEHTLVLEGHADERGSREYNIALGEERAKAVAKMMQARGVRVEQLEIVSYGEEKPAAVEHNETAWHFNRRVNLIPQRTQK